MSEFYDEMNQKSPTYKLHRKETFIWTGLTLMVIFLSWLFIWQMNNNALSRINDEVIEAQSKVQEGSKEYQKLKAYEEVAKTDPVGFDLSIFVRENYPTIVSVVYFILTALTLAVIARFIAFLILTVKRNKYYPSDRELEKFLDDHPTNWKDFYSRVSGMRHYGNAFWKVLKQSSTVINESRKYDHLYLHMRNRFDKVIDNINETTLYDSITSVSPAAGFFGTLIGLLYIFTQSENGIASLTGSPQFAVGLKVAIITSLWGLLNLGVAILFSYFTRKIAESIYDRMILKAFAICNRVEKFAMPEDDLQEIGMEKARETVNVG